jgi:hypothetical protein
VSAGVGAVVVVWVDAVVSTDAVADVAVTSVLAGGVVCRSVLPVIDAGQPASDARTATPVARTARRLDDRQQVSDRLDADSPTGASGPSGGSMSSIGRSLARRIVVTPGQKSTEMD